MCVPVQWFFSFLCDGYVARVRYRCTVDGRNSRKCLDAGPRKRVGCRDMYGVDRGMPYECFVTFVGVFGVPPPQLHNICARKFGLLRYSFVIPSSSLARHFCRFHGRGTHSLALIGVAFCCVVCSSIIMLSVLHFHENCTISLYVPSAADSWRYRSVGVH